MNGVNEGQQKDNYSKYVNDSQKNNTEREEHGLKPEQIMSFNEWTNTAYQQPVMTETNVPAK